MIGNRNILDQLGLGLFAFGIWGQYFWSNLWIITMVGGIVFIMSMFYPKAEVGEVDGARFREVFSIRSAPVLLRCFYYTLSAVILGVLVLANVEWYMQAVGVCCACAIIQGHILYGYWHQSGNGGAVPDNGG